MLSYWVIVDFVKENIYRIGLLLDSACQFYYRLFDILCILAGYTAYI